jgi:hypothetical protein
MASFAHFHERGLATPPHCFLIKLLDQYKLELQQLDPVGIQHITIFVALCKGFLGIEPHFNLWRHSSPSI